ncbi:citrate synthase [Vagococcus elongatus]|uniref:Citrate synthase n=1 Tax=Vagococcus elongatus TaxID=180344 RepID=A0A430B5Y3_9ENTE|nr:citrate synthase [Vagococcus elongatus]RSU15719.1 citrate synthase [Vagococcus elongatus]
MAVEFGLRGTFACETRISSIIDEQLAYAGYTIEELVDHQISFEETIYLLWYLKLPSVSELKVLTDDLKAHMEISDVIEAALRIQCRENLHPMSVLRSTISLLGVFDRDAEKTDPEATYLQAINIQAKMPTIIAAFSRLRRGLDPIPPRQDLSFAGNFIYMLEGKEPTKVQEESLNEGLVLHADHELNASTFAARSCASTLSDMYSCITTGIATLKGSLHGGANERVFEMLRAIDACGDTETYLQEKLDSKEKVMGFGHRVYQTVDPRQKYLKKKARELTVGTEDEKWYHLSIEVEHFMREKKGIIPNVDFYSATVYHSLGIESDLFTLIFAMSRTAGWVAHVFEQKSENTLIRPRSKYVGPMNLKFVPLELRENVSAIQEG